MNERYCGPVSVPRTEATRSFHSEFVLGTAQLGMNYGLVNRAGKPTKQAAVEMLKYAIAHGVTALDTARGYGEAECLIGETLTGNSRSRSRTRVITKLDLCGLGADASDSEVRQRVDVSINSSCEALCTEKLDTLLLHDWAHLDMWLGSAWQRLREQQDAGKISILGASVYHPHEALAALAEPAIQHLQFPMNVLDWRWKQIESAVARRPDVVVHARSALLQGILAHPADQWPVVAGFDNARCAQALRTLAEKFARESVPDLCLSYVRSLPWITSVVVGCETFDQLQENLRLFSKPKLSSEEIQELQHTLPKTPEELLNPAKWELRQKAAYAS